VRTKKHSFSELETLVRELQKKKPFGHNAERFGGVVEELIEWINHLGGAVTIRSDQWFGVKTQGALIDYNTPDEDEKEFETDVKGESLVLALIITYKKWKAAWEEFTGRSWGNDPMFNIIEM